jgi:hypothetical protein
MGIGAGGGGAGGFADALQQHKRGGALVGDTLLGAATGAVSNMNIGDELGLTVGFGAGVANSLGGDLINNHSMSVSDLKWAVLSGGLGAAENGIGTGLTNASPSGSPTVGNGWDAGLSGVQGLTCGGMDSQENWNC